MNVIAASIDLNKIDRSKVKDRDKDGKPFKNGAKYYDIVIVLNDEPDKYGNHASIQEGQTKQEREAKVEKKYLGNGKIIFSKGVEAKKGDAPQSNSRQEQTDDLPF